MLSSMRSKSHKRFCGDRKSTRIREQEVGGKNRICTTQAMDCRSSIGPTNARVIGELSSVQTRERSLRVRPMHSIVQPRCGKRRPMTRAFSRRKAILRERIRGGTEGIPRESLDPRTDSERLKSPRRLLAVLTVVLMSRTMMSPMMSLPVRDSTPSPALFLYRLC